MKSRKELTSLLATGAMVVAASVIVAAPAQAAQFARPTSDNFNDDADGKWTEGVPSADGDTSLWNEIDEVAGDGEDTYVQTETAMGSNAAIRHFNVGLGSVSDPGANSGHVIRIRAKKSQSSGVNIRLIVKLLDPTNGNASPVASFTTANLGSSWTNYIHTLTTTEAARIVTSEYTDLDLRIEADALAGSTTNSRRPQVTKAELELPDVASVGGPCNDGVDGGDSEDTLVDLMDPGCSSPFDTDESAPLPADPDCDAAHTVTTAENIRTEINSINSANQTVCIAGGTHVITGGTSGQTAIVPEDHMLLVGIGTAPAIIDATGSDYQVVIGKDSSSALPDQVSVEIRRLEVRGGTHNTTRASCEATTADCGKTIVPSDGWYVQHSRVRDGAAQGIGSPGENFVADAVEMDHNGNGFDDVPTGTNNGLSAGIKGGDFAGGSAFKVVNSWVHDNNQGIWCDRDCQDTNSGTPLNAEELTDGAGVGFVVQNNLVLDNYSFGIHYENTYECESGGGNCGNTHAEALIENNTAQGNDWGNPSGPKSDIGILSAENAVVRDNIVGPTIAHPALNLGFVAGESGDRGNATGSEVRTTLNGDSQDCLAGTQEPGFFTCD